MISGLDMFVLIANGVLAAVSLVAHIIASNLTDPRKRPLHAAIAVVCLIYVLGYTWVVITQDVFEWSRLFRGVSIIVWPLVWIAPAAQDIYLFRQDGRRIERQAEQ